MAGIFINYRRASTAAFAGRVFDRLSTQFGRERMFMDVDGIEPGEDFVAVLEKRLKDAVAMIVLIGPDWLQVKDSNGRKRLDDPHDFVRLEVATALRREVRVIPVLIDGVSMPSAQDLPPDLVLLSRRHAVVISNARFHLDIVQLVTVIEKLLDANGESSSDKNRPDEIAKRKIQAAKSAEEARLRVEQERLDELRRYKENADRLTWEARQKSGAGKSTAKAVAYAASGFVMLCWALAENSGALSVILFLISITLCWLAIRKWKARSTTAPEKPKPSQSRGKKTFVAVFYSALGLVMLGSAFAATDSAGNSAIFVMILFLTSVALFWAAIKKWKTR